MTTVPTAIAVACAADQQYALPLAVMLNSLGSRLGAGCAVEAYIADDGVAAADKDKVAASLPPQIGLHWQEAASLPPGLPTWGRMPVTTYQKLLVGDWLPASVERAMWLDCDLLILADAARLWSADLGGHIALAAQDQRVPLLSSKFGVAAHSELGLSDGAKYFNAGVMMIDVDRWRREDVAGRSLEYLNKYGESVYFWDQEALNAVLAGLWGELDSRWNWHPGLDHLAHPGSAGNEPEPWIVHFSGYLKPWVYGGAGPYRNLYHRYLDQTAWAGWRPARRWQGRLMGWYEMSTLRRLIYPAEQWATEIVRNATGEYHRKG